jgi:hypothetical protein
MGIIDTLFQYTPAIVFLISWILPPFFGSRYPYYSFAVLLIAAYDHFFRKHSFKGFALVGLWTFIDLLGITISICSKLYNDVYIKGNVDFPHSIGIVFVLISSCLGMSDALSWMGFLKKERTSLWIIVSSVLMFIIYR